MQEAGMGPNLATGSGRRLRKLLGGAAIHAALWAIGAVVAFPFLWMLLTALKDLGEAVAYPPTLLPRTPHWENFSTAWKAAPFGRYFFNTALVAGSVAASVMVTALLAGYAFGQMEFRGKKLLFGLYLATLMIPFEVVLIPNFLLISSMRLHDTYAAMILPWASNAFSVFLLTQFFRSLPRDYQEAAQLDGCGHWQYLWRVGAPLARPALTTAGLFAFLASWNALLWPLLVTRDDRLRPIEAGLQTFLVAEGPNPHLLMAASALAMLPIVLLFLAAQRTFIEGVSAGVKG